MENGWRTQQLARAALVWTLCLSGCRYAPDIARLKSEGSDFQAAVERASRKWHGPSQASKEQAPPTKPAGQSPWLPKSMKLPYRYSEIVYLDGRPIGYTHTEINPSATEDANLLRIKSSSLIEVARAGQTYRQKVDIESIERTDGTLKRYSEISISGSEHTESSGTVYQDKLHLVTKNLAAKNVPAKLEPEIDWPKSAWGPLGVQQILLSQPMRPREIFETQVFVPVQRQLAQVRLTAGDLETTSLPGNNVKEQLLPVDVVMSTEAGKVESRNWINESGEILKTVTLKGLNLASYRAPREVAEKFDSEVRVDILLASSVKLDRALPNPLSLKKVVYEVKAANLDPLTILSTRSNQELRSVTLRTAEVTVYRLERDSQLPNTVVEDPPSEACRKPTPFIQSNDPSIHALAVELTGQSTQGAAIAAKLTRGVYDRIKKKNFSRGFLSAVDVAHSMEGDCTEHAVLLAALLRNRSIAARLASGLVYTLIEGKPCMAYHLWVEAWIDNRWIPLDATVGGVIGPAYIKFFETPLEESNPYAALLPVMEGMGQLSIRVLAAQ